MVLGIRGQVSEIELDNSIHRMVEARWSKARRGELIITPPAGYEIDDQGLLVMTSDEAVASAIRLVFSKFDELGAARRVLIWWREQGLTFPVRRIASRKHPVVWVTPTTRNIYSTLHHPIYAGAYVHGRSKMVREVDTKGGLHVHKHMRAVAREQWPVLIKDHHAAYISYDKFLDLLRFHGLLAPHAKLRSLVVPTPPDAPTQPVQLSLFTHDVPPRPAPPAKRDPATATSPPYKGRHPWALLLRHVFAVDVTLCVQCQGRMTRFVIPEGVRLLELCTTPNTIARAMARVGLAPQPPPPAAKPRRAHPSQLRLALA